MRSSSGHLQLLMWAQKPIIRSVLAPPLGTRSSTTLTGLLRPAVFQQSDRGYLRCSKHFVSPRNLFLINRLQRQGMWSALVLI
jgi:hypothetical protein